MKKRKIAYIFKMIVKTMLLCFPMVMLFSSYYQKDQSQTTINYKYETNNVETESDFIVGNAYTYSSIYDTGDQIFFEDLFDEDTDFYVIGLKNLTFGGSYYIDDSYLFSSFYYTINLYVDFNIGEYSCVYINAYNTDSDFEYTYSICYDSQGDFYFYCLYDDFCSFDFVCMSDISLNDSSLISKFSSLDNSHNFIESVITTNKTPNQLLNDWALDFYNMPVNAWYKKILGIFNANLNNPTMNIIYLYPLYIVYVELLDIVLHFALLIPDLIHKALGDKD